ncbi:Protein of unknown function [Gryllus bimaculatus]|nr:Protein of unknown function [Gryllus bimaculatus]
MTACKCWTEGARCVLACGGRRRYRTRGCTWLLALILVLTPVVIADNLEITLSEKVLSPILRLRGQCDR